MTTKLTLRMDKILVAKAKQEAKHRGKSVSGMVADYFMALGEEAHPADTLPPVTASLFGVLKKGSVSEKDYRRHLKDKYF
ncbi:MAG: DUF6364 family protein [Syntrophorhabdales bacterium]